MMMLSWLSSIGDSIGIFIQFLTSTVTGILSVFALVGEAFSFIAVSWVLLPAPLLVFATAGISIVIVFHLIGR